MSGIFVMIDGLDGSGKGTAVKALKDWAESEGKTTFDLPAFQKEHKDHPKESDWKDKDVLISAEPTYALSGLAVRKEMINVDNKYHPLEIAEGFSNDRCVFYRKVILPALKQNKIIFQERGNVTSLAYQPLDAKLRKNIDITYKQIMHLPGNEFTFMHPPHLLIITTCEPETAMERLGKREKQDDAIFEELNFLTELEGVYESEWLKNIYEKLGTKVVFLDTGKNTSVEQTKSSAIKIFKEFLEEKE